jgi:hypothetical protein
MSVPSSMTASVVIDECFLSVGHPFSVYATFSAKDDLSAYVGSNFAFVQRRRGLAGDGCGSVYSRSMLHRSRHEAIDSNSTAELGSTALDGE